MKTKFVCGLIPLLGVLALQSTAYATFHEMQIEQVILSVNGDTTAQAIQLRMRAAGQNFVSGANSLYSTLLDSTQLPSSTPLPMLRMEQLAIMS